MVTFPFNLPVIVQTIFKGVDKAPATVFGQLNFSKITESEGFYQIKTVSFKRRAKNLWSKIGQIGRR